MNRYEVVKRIGKGSFGTVDLVRRRKDVQLFVRKRMKIGSAVSSKEREMCHNEVHLLERLNHPSIVRYEESFIQNQLNEAYLCVIMSHCDGGDLAQFLNNQRSRHLREKHVLDLLVQVALAMQFLHNRNILHRDLKAQNIFVKGGQLKLGDFGISKVLTSSMAFAQTMIGTPYYMSPEVFKGKPYDFKSDIWSLGCVLYEMMTFKHAFDANSLNALTQKILKGKYLPILHHQYRNELKLLCYSMLNISPSKRPSLNDILKHALLKNRIRDFYISCHNKCQQNILPASTFKNLQTQLHEVGLAHILENIDDIAKQQNLKKEEQKKIQQEQQSIEHEKKIQRDMEAALEKLRAERRWRAAQKKRAPHRINRSKPAVTNASDQRRAATKQRKLQLLAEQEQKRQQLEAKHRKKQHSAAQRKKRELHRKSSYSNISSPLDRNQSPSKESGAKKGKPSLKDVNSTDRRQVEQLNVWENVHFNHKNSKLKRRQEYDALDGLKKRRELIQRRLDEITERHRQRQRHKQNRQSSSEQLPNRSPPRRSKSELPTNPSPTKNVVYTKPTVSALQNIQQTTSPPQQQQQTTPYKKPPIRDSRIPFASPNKPPTQYHQQQPSSHPRGQRRHSLPSSRHQSPFKSAGARAIGILSASTESSPRGPQQYGMTPRERMEARKRAKADARAHQLNRASKNVFHQNKVQAHQNRNAVRSGHEQHQQLPEMPYDDIDDMQTQSEPCLPMDMDEFPQRITTIHENPYAYGDQEEQESLIDEDEEEEEDDDDDAIIEDEIDELKQTMAEHTVQIEEIKNSILVRQQQQLHNANAANEDNISENENDDGDDDHDVESMLNEHEETMRNGNENQMSVINRAKPSIACVKVPDDEDESNSDASSEEMPIGRLADRIEFIKKKCITGMSLNGFKMAYTLMKQVQYETNEELLQVIETKIQQLCEQENISVSKQRIAKYRSLIDQLLFIEANCS